MANNISLTTLQAENARLVALLEAHGIEWRLSPMPGPSPTILGETESTKLNTAEKVALFRRLFQGGTDYGVLSSLLSGMLNAVANRQSCRQTAVPFSECLGRMNGMPGAP
ncbi:hypothetical protein [Dyella nitratireducens]|uniref:hypothetical protein n=1 Tax=Dyella nitratireducens TaxID=1849580 RepID=UPI00166D3C25|nr:hypothetical protein [Dyella nitratireducens]